MTPCLVSRLGCVPYEAAWALMRQLATVEQPDRLLLLSHPHTFTLGTGGDDTNLLWDADERARRGVAYYRVDRGGDVTYHGKGQLVGYPILRLLPPMPDQAPRPGSLRLGVVDYLRKLERVLIAALADEGIPAKTISGLTGVWVDTPKGEAKIAAMGVKVTVKAITQHGFAINLNTDLSYFEGIIPCGIRDKAVTSVAALTGQPVDEAAFATRLVQHFGEGFGVEMVAAPALSAINAC